MTSCQACSQWGRRGELGCKYFILPGFLVLFLKFSPHPWLSAWFTRNLEQHFRTYDRPLADHMRVWKLQLIRMLILWAYANYSVAHGNFSSSWVFWICSKSTCKFQVGIETLRHKVEVSMPKIDRWAECSEILNPIRIVYVTQAILNTTREYFQLVLNTIRSKTWWIGKRYLSNNLKT